MGALGSLISDRIDQLTGKESHSTIDKFFSKFNSSVQHYVDTLDTLNTFDCKFKFYPGVGGMSDSKGFGDKLLDMGKSAIGNITGGLVDLTGGGGKEPSTENGRVTFLSYLMQNNLLQTESTQPYLEVDLSYYIQTIQTPNVNIQTGETIDSPVGRFPITGSCTTPQSNSLNMDILNTKAPLIERFFYPWMKEVSMTHWMYDEQPFTTADITVSLTKHAEVSYIFVGARPVTIDTYNPSQENNGTPTRSVSFAFDYMFINSSDDAKQSTKDKLLDVGKSLVGGVASTFGL